VASRTGRLPDQPAGAIAGLAAAMALEVTNFDTAAIA
jgi:hypothetical protein